MANIPVYVFTGFLESGKTSFVREILRDENFTDDEHTLYLCCEEGVEELSQDELRKANTVRVPVEKKDELNPTALKLLEKKFRPDRIVVEYNGMWELPDLIDAFPASWELYQIVTTVNGQTFTLYSNNMGPRMFEHVSTADLVVFNRCTPAIKQELYDKNIRAMNPQATIFLEDTEGNPEDYNRNMPLPFDIDAPIIELKDTDFGYWYLDAMGEPEKYDGKTVHFLGMVFNGKGTPKGYFVPGRFGMVCCAEDVRFLGFLCEYQDAAKLTQREFVEVTATISVAQPPQYKAPGPVLHALSVKPAKAPAEELVYFN